MIASTFARILPRLIGWGVHEGAPFPLSPAEGLEGAIKLARHRGPCPPEALITYPAALPNPIPVDRVSIDELLADPERPGQRLACYLPTDEDPADPWLSSPDYYPLYHALIRMLMVGRPCPRILEVGVRTGYMIAVAGHALGGRGRYTGVDPNLYLPEGLELARQTGRTLERLHPGYAVTLIEGFSTASALEATIALQGPYDLIHVDGDHSMRGKVHDLALARHWLAPNGYLLADDFGHEGSVSAASRAALEVGWYGRFSYVPTLRGMGVLAI